MLFLSHHAWETINPDLSLFSPMKTVIISNVQCHNQSSFGHCPDAIGPSHTGDRSEGILDGNPTTTWSAHFAVEMFRPRHLQQDAAAPHQIPETSLHEGKPKAHNTRLTPKGSVDYSTLCMFLCLLMLFSKSCVMINRTHLFYAYTKNVQSTFYLLCILCIVLFMLRCVSMTVDKLNWNSYWAVSAQFGAYQ